MVQADPVRRYHETVARSESLKSEGEQAAGTTAVIEIAGLAPPVVHATIAQALYATRLFNVTITNVPGPKQTLYAFGAPLREIHPLVPLAAEHAVGVAALSYDGNVFFGVVADRDTVPDLGVLLSALQASVQELLSAARAGGVGLKDSAPRARRARQPPARRKVDGALYSALLQTEGNTLLPNDRRVISLRLIPGDGQPKGAASVAGHVTLAPVTA